MNRTSYSVTSGDSFTGGVARRVRHTRKMTTSCTHARFVVGPTLMMLVTKSPTNSEIHGAHLIRLHLALTRGPLSRERCIVFADRVKQDNDVRSITSKWDTPADESYIFSSTWLLRYETSSGTVFSQGSDGGSTGVSLEHVEGRGIGRGSLIDPRSSP